MQFSFYAFKCSRCGDEIQKGAIYFLGGMDLEGLFEQRWCNNGCSETPEGQQSDRCITHEISVVDAEIERIKIGQRYGRRPSVAEQERLLRCWSKKARLIGIRASEPFLEPAP